MSGRRSKFNIRQFNSSDYDAVARIHCALFPDHPTTAEELRKEDARRDPKCICRRWIGEQDGKPIACGGFWQWIETYIPTEFTLIGGVEPEHRNMGLGSKMYTVALEALQTHKPTVLRAHSRVDRTFAIDFLTRRGFVEFMREQEWELDLGALDESCFDKSEESIADDSIKIKTLPDLAGDPDRDRKLYNLTYEILRDTPRAQLIEPMEFPVWQMRFLKNPNLLPDSFMVAVANGDYIGKTHMEELGEAGALQTLLTGVRRDYRRRGIAQALKLRSLAWAKSAGYGRVLTDNESENTAMLTLNEKIGFAKLPAWVFFELKF
jgi:GNAT superfamily N-acetyltransferase